MTDKLEILFGAPMLRVVWTNTAELNQDLKTLILQKSKTVASATQSNKGGWQSPRDLQTWQHASIKRFLKMANLAVKKLTAACIGRAAVSELKHKWTLAAWANVNRFSNYNGLHNHAGAFWSGVYYVSVGDPRGDSRYEGSISFRNPTLAPLVLANLNVPPVMNQICRTKYVVEPVDGLMLVFPSWLEHYVHPYFGKGTRISISWDVMFP
jgi:uncharacterized protein (TIGR02466 family)